MTTTRAKNIPQGKPINSSNSLLNNNKPDWNFWTTWVLVNSVVSAILGCIILSMMIDKITFHMTLSLLLGVSVGLILTIVGYTYLDNCLSKYKPRWQMPLRKAVKFKGWYQSTYLIILPILFTTLSMNHGFFLIFIPEFYVGAGALALTEKISIDISQPFLFVLCTTLGTSLLMAGVIWILSLYFYCWQRLYHK